MTKKWMTINLMLLAATVLLARQLYVTTLRFKQDNSLANIMRMQPGKKGGAEAPLPPVQSVAKLSDAEYTVIPQGNPFTETRRPEEKVEAPAPEPPRRLDNPPILVGIIASGSRRQAMIVDTTAPAPSGNRRTQTMKIGDSYRGFIVTDITSTGIVLESGPSREIVPLFAPGKTPQSGKTPPMAVRVVNFTPGQAGAASASTALAAGGRATMIPSATPSAPGARPGQTSTPAQQRANPSPPQQGQFFQPGIQSLPNQFIDAQGRQVIQTPFGVLPAAQPVSPAQTPVKK